MLPFGETIGETQFIKQLLAGKRIDLSTSEGQEFLERFVGAQLRATRYLAEQIDGLKDEVARLRRELLSRGVISTEHTD